MKWFIFHLHSGFCITEIFCHVTRGQGVESSFFSYVTEETKVSSEAVSEYLESKRKYEEMRMEKLKKGSSREAQVSHRKCLTSVCLSPAGGAALYSPCSVLCLKHFCLFQNCSSISAISSNLQRHLLDWHCADLYFSVCSSRIISVSVSLLCEDTVSSGPF